VLDEQCSTSAQAAAGRQSASLLDAWPGSRQGSPPERASCQRSTDNSGRHSADDMPRWSQIPSEAGRGTVRRGTHTDSWWTWCMSLSQNYQVQQSNTLWCTSQTAGLAPGLVTSSIEPIWSKLWSNAYRPIIWNMPSNKRLQQVCCTPRIMLEAQDHWGDSTRGIFEIPRNFRENGALGQICRVKNSSWCGNAHRLHANRISRGQGTVISNPLRCEFPVQVLDKQHCSSSLCQSYVR